MQHLLYPCIQTTLEGGGDVYRRGDSSTAGVTDWSTVYRARLVYRGEDSSTEGKTHLRIGRLVYGGGDLSKEG